MGNTAEMLVLSLAEPACPPGWDLPAAPSPGGLHGGAGLAAAAGRWAMCQKLPQSRAGAAPASGRGRTGHLCMGTGTAGIPSAAGDPPACRPEPAAVGAVPGFPMQSNQKAVAPLKSLKFNHLEGKIWLGYFSSYHDRSQALGCDKITCC